MGPSLEYDNLLLWKWPKLMHKLSKTFKITTFWLRDSNSTQGDNLKPMNRFWAIKLHPWDQKGPKTQHKRFKHSWIKFKTLYLEKVLNEATIPNLQLLICTTTLLWPLHLWRMDPKHQNALKRPWRITERYMTDGYFKFKTSVPALDILLEFVIFK